MPDSPPFSIPKDAPNPRNPGRFFGPGTSKLFAAAGGGDEGGMDMGGEGSGAPPRTAEERIAQMEAQMTAMRDENVQLAEELERAPSRRQGQGSRQRTTL